MSKVDEIKNRLAQSLEKQSTRPPAVAPETVAPTQPDAPAARPAASRPASAEVARKKADTGQPGTKEGVIKLSASLYSFDIQCLDRIREFMRGKGIRNITDSEALRLACRAVKINDALMDIYEGMTREDRRRRKQ